MNHLTVLIGAGFNLDFVEALSSKNITEMVLNFDGFSSYNTNIKKISQESKDIYSKILDKIKAHYPDKTISFETVIDYIFKALSDNDYYDIKEELRITSSDEDYRKCLYYVVCTIIYYINQNKPTIDEIPKQLSDLFIELNRRWHLDIYTLNYDSILESILRRADIDFDDGFRETEDPLAPCVFDAHSFIHGEDKNRLCHNHGSIYYSRKMIEGMKKTGSFYKHCSVSKDYLFDLLRTQNGERQLYSPIVTGMDKTSLLPYDPFSTYHMCLKRSLIDNDSLLIIGYGFGDYYINTMINTFLKKEKASMVIINPFCERYSDNVNVTRIKKGIVDATESIDEILIGLQ